MRTVRKPGSQPVQRDLDLPPSHKLTTLLVPSSISLSPRC